MSEALIAVNGVLRDEKRRVIPEGRRLVAALGEVYRVVLALDDNEVEAFNIWAKMENIVGHQEVMPADVAGSLRGYDERVSQVTHLKGRGAHVALVVDSSPERIAEVIKHGVVGLLYADVGTTRPEWLPDWDDKPRPWDEIVREIEMAHYKQTVETSDS